MAKKRMFSLDVVDTDAFLEMPLSSQALYFHLSMRADDDGFVSSPKRIMKTVGCQEDDLKILVAKRYVLSFESGIIVIKHWRLNNYIRGDRYTETNYEEEKESLTVKKNGVYTDNKKLGIPDDIPLVDLDKNRLDKISIDKDRESTPSPKEIAYSFFNNETDRKDKITLLIDKYNLDKKFITGEINKFVNYWSELNGTGKKQRWEMEKTFELDRRLSSWFLRSSQFNKNNNKTIQSI